MRFLSVVALVMLIAIAVVGCGKPAADAPAKTPVANDVHDHSGWWCAEHGVPEGVCAQCNISLVADFKAKGDWCTKHERPDSQCFPCHPEKEAEFAAQYEAKFGKPPPERS
jgi:cobalt-zinc-cadmium efflux system membrane fusion protein